MRRGWRTSGEELEALTLQYGGPSAQALDLGCGRGGVLEAYWRRMKLAVGLDPDLVSLMEHRAKMPRACGRGEALPFSDGTFSLVLAIWVLEHLAEPTLVLREVRRVLAPAGHFIFLTPNALHPLIRLNRFSWALPLIQRLLIPCLYGRAQADTFRVRYRANTPGRLRALARGCGFETLTLRPIRDPTYLAFSDLLFRLSVAVEERLPPSWGVHLLGDFVRV